MATMRDVAKLAGVSLATVSFAINNTKPVAPATLERVREAMDTLDYRPNAIARALASKRTRIIALLFPMEDHSLSGTALKFFTAAAEAASELGYNLILWPGDNGAEHIDRVVSNGLIDGVILMEVHLHDERVVRLRELGVPFTLIGRTRELSGISYVDVNFEGAVIDALARFEALGHRSIGIVFDDDGDPGTSDYGPVARTRDTYLERMRAIGATPGIFSCAESSSAGRALVPRILAEMPDVTALLLINEHASPGIVSALAAHGRPVPEAVSVLVVGASVDIVSAADPELTVYESPSRELGRRGVRDLIQRLENPDLEPAAALVDCRYVDVNSIAPARQRA